MAVGLALLPALGALAAQNPAVPNPTPDRASKVVVDFTSAVTAMADPLQAGENRASINTDPQFTVAGTKSLKVDLNGVPGNSSGWADPFVTIGLPQPVDIKGYQVLTMDVYVPAASVDSNSADSAWYQIYPRLTLADPSDATKTIVSNLPLRNLNRYTPGWNHLMWNLKTGTDTQISQVAFATGTNGSQPYSGPIYLDNIRVYQGNFAGLQPDEKLIFGFDNPSDASLLTVGDATGATVNTNKQFISQGTSSLAIDLTGQGTSGMWTNNVVSATDLGVSVDISNATAIHLDVYVPSGSEPNNSWQQLGFGVVTDSGNVDTNAQEFLPDQWNTFEIPLTADQAKTLGHVKGIYILRNQGDAWRGPVYVDGLRAVVPTTTTPAPTAGG
jgi:hypothetical protein